MQPGQQLGFGQLDPFQTSNLQNCQIISVSCLLAIQFAVICLQWQQETNKNHNLSPLKTAAWRTDLCRRQHKHRMGVLFFLFSMSQSSKRRHWLKWPLRGLAAPGISRMRPFIKSPLYLLIYSSGMLRLSSSLTLRAPIHSMIDTEHGSARIVSTPIPRDISFRPNTVHPHSFISPDPYFRCLDPPDKLGVIAQDINQSCSPVVNCILAPSSSSL